MEIVVSGRNADISDRFREHVEEKIEKISLYAPRAQRVDVELTHEKNPRLMDVCDKIEITVRDKGPVIRAEAASSDRYSALDLACAKLFERLRRARDRRKNHHRGRDLHDLAYVDDIVLPAHEEKQSEEVKPTIPTRIDEETEMQLGDSPVVVRQKLHEAQAMTVEQAIDQMELVGHPFYLFIDVDTSQPCVAYRRHGWTYGVIRLDVTVS